MKKNEEGRRSFLKHVLAGSAVVTGVAATLKPASAGKNLNIDRGKSDTLYSETEDFRKYYKSIRS